MADVIKIPIQLSGIQKAASKIQQSFKKNQVSAAQLREELEKLTRQQTAYLKATGAPAGTFRTQAVFKDAIVGTRVKDGNLENVTRDIVAQVESVVERDLQDKLKTKRRRILRRTKGASTPQLQKALTRQEELLQEVMTAYADKAVPLSFVDQVRDDIKRLEQAVKQSQKRDTKEQTAKQTKKIKESTRRADRKVKEALAQIDEFSLDSVSSVQAAQQQAENLMLKLTPDVGKPGKVSQSMFDRLAAKERSLRKMESSKSKQEAEKLARQSSTDAKNSFADRRRNLKRRFDEADGNQQELNSVLKDQQDMLFEANKNMKKGIFKTNSQAQQMKKDIDKTREAAHAATIDPENMVRSQRFGLMTPAEQKAEMNRRRAIHQKALGRQKQMQKERNKAISESTLGAASVGIGLLGQAGFPLLNVGFAAMSSPMIGAAAALSTALGETSRASRRLTEATLASAEGLGFLTKGFKDTRGELEAVKAFFGGLAEIGEQARLQRDIDLLRSDIRGAISVQSSLQAYFDVPKRMFTDAIGDTLNNPLGNLKNLIPGYALVKGAGYFAQAGRDSASNELRFENSLDERIREAEKKLFQFSSRFETGEGMFDRIQQAAASRREDPVRIAMKQLEVLKEMRDELRKAEDEETERERRREENADRRTEEFIRQRAINPGIHFPAN